MESESFPKPEGAETPAAEQRERGEERAPAEERKINEESPVEIEKKASEFDGELSRSIQERIESGALSPEDAERLSREANELRPEEKAELAGKLDDVESSPKSEQEREAAEQFQERITGYEEAVDNLIERAKALGVEISPERLKEHLDKLKNAEFGEKEKEQEEWNKSFEMRIGALEAQMKHMERMKELGILSSEKGKEVQQDFKASFDQLVEQAVKFAVKVAVAVFKGLYKGIMGALRKGKEGLQ